MWRATRTPDGPATTAIRVDAARRRRSRRGPGARAPPGRWTGCPTCSASPTTRAGFVPGHPVAARGLAPAPRLAGAAVAPGARGAGARRPGAEGHRPGGVARPCARWCGGTASRRPGRSTSCPAACWVPPAGADLGRRAVLGVAPGRRRPVPLAHRRHRRRVGRPARGARRRSRRPRRPRRLRSLPGVGVWTAAEVGPARPRRRRRGVGRRLPPVVPGRARAGRGAGRRRRDARAARALPRAPLPRGAAGRAVRRTPRAARAALRRPRLPRRCDPRGSDDDQEGVGVARRPVRRGGAAGCPTATAPIGSQSAGQVEHVAHDVAAEHRAAHPGRAEALDGQRRPGGSARRRRSRPRTSRARRADRRSSG